MAKNKYNIDPWDVSDNEKAKSSGGSWRKPKVNINIPAPKVAPAPEKKSSGGSWRKPVIVNKDKLNNTIQTLKNAEAAKTAEAKAADTAARKEIMFQKPAYNQGGFTKTHYDLGRISRLSEDQLKAKISPKYDEMRKQAEQLGQTQLQGQELAMQRRLARLGGGPSGFAEKQAMLAQQNVAEQVAGAKGDIAVQQEAELSALDEAEKARQFATTQQMAEQLAQQGMMSDQMSFQRQERLAGERAQTMATNYANLEKLKEQNKNLANNKAIAKMEMAIKQDEAEWQKIVDQFNMDMAESEANRKDMFAKLGEVGTNAWMDLFERG